MSVSQPSKPVANLNFGYTPQMDPYGPDQRHIVVFPNTPKAITTVTSTLYEFLGIHQGERRRQKMYVVDDDRFVGQEAERFSIIEPEWPHV